MPSLRGMRGCGYEHSSQTGQEIDAPGGRLAVEVGHLVIDPSQAGQPQVGELRQHKQAILAWLSHRPRMDGSVVEVRYGDDVFIRATRRQLRP